MLGRTLITSLTTLLVLFALLILGGDFIQNFAIAMAKFCIKSPPKISSANKTNKVVKEVIRVLPNI